MIVVLALGCRAQPAVVVPAQAEPVIEMPVVEEPAARPSWCDLPVVDLQRGAGPLGPSLGDRVAATDIVALARTELSRSDCTSVGHTHAVFVPAPGDGSGLQRAYYTAHLPGGLPAGAFYVLGASVVPRRVVDLRDVCIEWRGDVDADATWVVPIADEAEAELWRQRLSEGLCGRAPVKTPG
jgi:hypothetical protein